MKRICIYVTYDFENIVDDYVGYMLQELRKSVDCLAVVCNYAEVVRGIENIQPYADRIYYRENIGFDAGAYKDALCTYLGWDEIARYDELLIINDSFYGPLYPMEDLFNEMEKTSADYWGIIRAPKGEFDDGYSYDTHIQSYFMAFRSNILTNPHFKVFWEELKYPRSLYEAVKAFEIGINACLKGHGFTGIALTDITSQGQPFQANEIPYMQYALELVRDFKIPILKRRSLYFSNKGFENALRALIYIKSKNIYDVALVEKHLARISQSANEQGLMDIPKMDSFCRKHKKIYFYGAGVYGHNLAAFFKYMGWEFNGFLVTNAAMQSENCHTFRSVRLGEDDGIIIAVGDKRICFEILGTVGKCFDKNRVLYPNFDIGNIQE